MVNPRFSSGSGTNNRSASSEGINQQRGRLRGSEISSYLIHGNSRVASPSVLIQPLRRHL